MDFNEKLNALRIIFSYLTHRVWVEISRSEEERGEAIPVDRYLESYGVPLQLINDVSVQVEVGGACLCDSTAAPPLLDIATVAITDYYNSYVSSAFFIGCSVDVEMVTGYRHVRLSIRGSRNLTLYFPRVNNRNVREIAFTYYFHIRRIFSKLSQ